MSFKRLVVAALPPVVHSSRPEALSSALKNVSPAAGVNSCGTLPGAPGLRSPSEAVK